MSKEFKPQIYYLARRKWYEQLNKCCDVTINKKGKDPLAIFWKAFATGMSGNISESLRLLEGFQSRRDMQYPVTIARLYFHKKASVIDHEAIESLNSDLSVAEDVTKEAGLVLAARFALFTQDTYDARRLAEKLLQNNKSGGNDGNALTAFEVEAIAIQQWCLLADIEESGEALQADQKKKLQAVDGMYRGRAGSEVYEVDSLMVWAQSRLALGLSNDGINILNQIIATYPWFQPALADKALLLATSGEWDQALDTAQRLLDVDPESLDSLQVIAVHAFTQESHAHDAVQKLDDLDSSMRAREPASTDYALEIVELFSGICARQPRALQICVRILERALKNNLSVADEARVFCAIGNVLTLQGPMQYDKAAKCFRDAVQRDNSSVQALEGMITCQLCEGLADEAESQIELLLLMHNREDLGYKFLYLQSLLLRNKRDSKRAHIDALDDCREAFLSAANGGGVPGLGETKAYLNAFRGLRSRSPDFLMLLATDYLSHSDPSSGGVSAGASIFGTAAGSFHSQLSGDNQESTQQPMLAVDDSSSSSALEISPPVQRGLDLLNMVLRQCPGIVSAYVELGRCYSSLGMHEDASRTLQHCLSQQPNCAPVLLAMAKVELSRSKIAAADRVLEQTLACDFSIRSAPLFKLVKASVRSQQGRLDEALVEIEQLLALPEFGYSITAGPSANSDSVLSGGAMFASYADSLRLTESDRVGVYVTYASLLGKLRRMKDANKVLGHAKVIFAGTQQEVQVLVAASQLFVEKGDFDSAIRMLDKIAEDSPTYSRAQLIKADIILTNNRDKEGYTKCFQQLADKEPSAKNFSLLGEAYLRILNPEAAIDALDRAYKLDPSNSRLRGRIGRTLVSTHEYHRAIEFYESAIRELQKSGGKAAGGVISTDIINLSHDLAKLYIKLGRAQNSIRVLNSILREDPPDLTALRQDVATLLILTRVQQQFNAPADILDTYMRAHALQKEVVLKVRSTVTGGLAATHDVVETERAQLSTICDKIGGCHVGLGDVAKAEAMFLEAVQHNLHNTSAMTGLARLYFNRSDRDLCVAQCNKIITAVPESEEAAVLLSDVLFQSDDPAAAVAPLTNLLKLQPNNYVALEKAITLFRRAGKLDEAVAFLKAAEKADRRCSSHAGYHFCQGLYSRFTNDIGKAISEFNLSRKDEFWGAGALVHMVELYLNPDQEGAWEEKDAGPLDESTRANIAAAEQLLAELRPKATDQLRVKILENYCSLATRHKTNVDRAMQSFSEMLDSNQDYLPAVLGMATGFMVEKNQHKARNLLKRVGKMELSRHDGEDFERANLLLAKFYIDKGKGDMAQEVCQKMLLQNKSCSQAWELLGLVYEKEANYDLASDAYDKAWKLEFEASASVGFKLAFTRLKCRQFVQAIDVCEAVLALYPDYPRIGEEILKKAQHSLRTTA